MSHLFSRHRHRWLFAALIISVVLTGCATSQPVNGRLIVWHTWEAAEAPIIEEMLADFQRLHPEIHISIERKEYDTALDEFAEASQAGLGPDVLIGIESVFAHLLYERGWVTNIASEAIDWNQFEASTLRSVQRDNGVRVGVPLNAYVSVLFYNPALIDEPPTSIESLFAVSQSGMKVGIPTTFFAGYWGVTGLGGTVFDEDALSDESVSGISEWLEWMFAFQQTPGAVLSPDLPALKDGFARGDLALLVDNSLELASLQEALGEEQVGVVTIPGSPTSQPFSTVELMVVNSASVQLDAAAVLMNFMSNEAQQRKLARATSGRAPVNRTVSLDPTLFPRVSEILAQNQTAVVPTTAQDDLLNLLIIESDPIYQQVLEGLISAEEGAQMIIDAVNRDSSR